MKAKKEQLLNMLLIVTIFKHLICAGLLQIYITPAMLSTETKLFKHLFDGYSRDVRPVLNSNAQIIVKVGVELIQLIDIFERDQTIMMKIYIRLEWRNELLKWKPRNWGNISSININPDSVWLPDIILYEEVKEEMSKGTRRYQSRISVTENGTHFWIVPLLIKSSCPISVSGFPFDVQICTLKFGSWLLDETQLNLISDNRSIVTSALFIRSSKWDLVNVSRKRNHVKYPCCDNRFIDISFIFSFQRKSLYYVLNLIVPCILLIIIVLSSFLLPSDCIERIGIIVTVLLAFIVFLQIVDTNLPETSESTPILSVFYLTAIVESVGSIIGTCLVILIYRRGMEKEPRPVPQWIRKYILKTAKNITESGENGSLKNKVFAQENSICLNKCVPISNNDIPIGTLTSGNSIYSKPNPASPGLSDLSSMANTKQKGSIVDERRKKESIEKEWQLFAEILDRGVFVSLPLFSIEAFCSTILPEYFKSI